MPKKLNSLRTASPSDKLHEASIKPHTNLGVFDRTPRYNEKLKFKWQDL